MPQLYMWDLIWSPIFEYVVAVFAILSLVCNGIAWNKLRQRKSSSALDEVFRWFVPIISLGGISYAIEVLHFFITSHFIFELVSKIKS